MLKIKHLLFLTTFFSFHYNYAQFTDAINSNRPGESMSAFSVGKTVIQAEFGTYAIKEKYEKEDYKANDFGTTLCLRYGAFFEQLELILNLDYQNEKFITTYDTAKRSGLKRTNFGAKYLVYDPEKNYEKKPNLYSYNANHSFNWRQFIPAVGVYGGINLNLKNDLFPRYPIPLDTKFNFRGMIITQNHFGRNTFLTNIIFDKLPTQKASIDYVVTMTHGFSPRWSGFMEAQGFSGTFYADSFLRAGAAYLLEENMQLDASMGTNFKESPSLLFGSIGLSWRFDDFYDDVMLRIQKEDKGEDKSKKDKKKEKSRKKFDVIETDTNGK